MEDYETNIDFTRDKALLRRAAFLHYTPNVKDVLGFIKNHNYHGTIQKIMQKLDGNYWDYSTMNDGDEQDIEGVTTLGSFHDWNQYMIRYGQLTKTNPDTITIEKMLDLWSTDIQPLYFNKKLGATVYKHLITLKNLWELDIQSQVIDPGTIPEEFLKYKEEILIRVKAHYIEKGKDQNYISKYATNVINIFKDRKEFIMTIVQGLTDTYGNTAAVKFLENLDYNDKTHMSIITAINHMGSR